MLRLLLYISILAGSQAFFFSRSPDWDKLQVTFGINVFSSGTFSHLPRTVLAARDEGFTELSGCGATPMFAGRRFAKNGDLAVVLIFDVNGIIAGIQAGFSSNQYNGSPDDPIRNHPFVEYDHHQFVTAYFTDPGSICSRGRTSDQYSEEGTGTRLLIQNGTTPREYITIPMTETGIRTTRWTRGKCFPWMGVHYWYDISRDMDCGRFFPVFLMYNGGKLNSFGWAFNADLTSPRYEHPPSSQFRFKVAVNGPQTEPDDGACRGQYRPGSAAERGKCERRLMLLGIDDPAINRGPFRKRVLTPAVKYHASTKTHGSCDRELG